MRSRELRELEILNCTLFRCTFPTSRAGYHFRAFNVTEIFIYFFDININSKLIDGLIKKKAFVLDSFVSPSHGIVCSTLNPISILSFLTTDHILPLKSASYYAVHPNPLALMAKGRNPWIVLHKYQSGIFTVVMDRQLIGC